MVMFSPFGTSGRYFDTGSVTAIFPSCASCRMAVAVHVLVLEPIRMWSPSATASPPPRSVVPYVAVIVPDGVRSSATAPGNRNSFAPSSSAASSPA